MFNETPEQRMDAYCMPNRSKETSCFAEGNQAWLPSSSYPLLPPAFHLTRPVRVISLLPTLLRFRVFLSLLTPYSLRLVALAEWELNAIGKQRHLHEKLDMGKLSPLPSGRKIKTNTYAKSGRGSSGALEASTSALVSLEPSRALLDNVGEREVKVNM